MCNSVKSFIRALHGGSILTAYQGGFGRFPNGVFRYAIDPNLGQCSGDVQGGSRAANAVEANSAAASAA
ncbi:hypothetical protein EST38_g13058 [Candolleomyces aberdarensis]|uniref:Uncharacterized protein n=1 Tax=Candolleomyces aberdarensis TaxID=2316362 RepID=A0A4V1Q1U4_9AGAR|nr:hypothetical protein EST38_g13058 [Candolleomyces aberdarensis]